MEKNRKSSSGNFLRLNHWLSICSERILFSIGVGFSCKNFEVLSFIYMPELNNQNSIACVSIGGSKSDGSGRRMREVACPICTVHLQVHGILSSY